MKSYNEIGTGFLSFEEKIREVKEIIMSEVRLDKCPLPKDVSKDVPDYEHLIDYVCGRTQKLFENNPTLPFWIDLRGHTRLLYIRIKMTDRIWPSTLLTLELSKCRTKAPGFCEQSLRWSNEAFQSIFGG